MSVFQPVLINPNSSNVTQPTELVYQPVIIVPCFLELAFQPIIIRPRKDADTQETGAV